MEVTVFAFGEGSFSAVYIGIAMIRFGATVSIVTNKQLLPSLQQEAQATGIEFFLVPSMEDPTTWANETTEKISNSDLALLVAGPNEAVPQNLARYLSSNVGLRVGLVTDQQSSDHLQFIDLVCFRSNEDAIITESDQSLLATAREFSEAGASEIVAVNKDLSGFAYSAEDNEGIDVMSYRTTGDEYDGAVETWFGAYIGARGATDDLNKAGHFAGMAAALKIRYAGPLQESAEIVERRLAEIYNEQR